MGLFWAYPSPTSCQILRCVLLKEFKVPICLVASLILCCLGFLPKDLWVNTDDASQTWQVSQLMWHKKYPIDIHMELTQPNTVNVVTLISWSEMAE